MSSALDLFVLFVSFVVTILYLCERHKLFRYRCDRLDASPFLSSYPLETTKSGRLNDREIGQYQKPKR